MDAAAPDGRLIAVHLDEASLGRGTPDQEHERRVAAADLLDGGRFEPQGHVGGPYGLLVGLHDAKLRLTVRTVDGRPVATHTLSLAPFRTILRDYRLVCETYEAATRTATPARLEAIDMGRRSLHDAAAHLLASRLEGKVAADFATMRRLFTLITVLRWTR